MALLRAALSGTLYEVRARQRIAQSRLSQRLRCEFVSLLWGNAPFQAVPDTTFMFLKNYTSKVPVFRTVARIEQLLAEAGASDVTKTYVSGELRAIMFAIDHDGKRMQFRLPADVQKIYQYMLKEVKRPSDNTQARLMEQAERTAWKLLQDSLEIECTRLKLQQTEFLQVFLAYVWDGNMTFFESLKSGSFKQLPERATG